MAGGKDFPCIGSPADLVVSLYARFDDRYACTFGVRPSSVMSTWQHFLPPKPGSIILAGELSLKSVDKN
jgi:hypothetical protein